MVTERHVELLDGIGFEWEPSETAWAKLLAQLVVFKEELGGCTTVPQSWGKKMNKKLGVEEAPNWWSEELATWWTTNGDSGRPSRSSRRSAPRPRRPTPAKLQSATPQHRLLYVVVFQLSFVN